MSQTNEPFSNELNAFLDQRLPKAEADSLREQGFKIKKPTRKTAVMAALYKKAVSGDLSAIKELRSIAQGQTDSSDLKVVRIIDDI